MNTILPLLRKPKNIPIIIIILLQVEIQAETNLVFWIDYADKQEIEFYRNQIRSYENIHPDVHVSIKQFKDLQMFLLNRYMSSSDHDLPDIIRGVSDGIGVFVENNMITPLNEFLQESELEQFNFAFIEGVTYKNAIYALPCSFETLCLFVNTTYFSETINSISELERQSPVFETNNIIPLATNIVEPYRFIPWYYGFNGTFFDEDNNPIFNRDAFIAATQYILDLLEHTKVMAPEISNETAIVLFIDGWAATLISGPWDLDMVMKEDTPFFVQALPTIAKGRRLKPYIGLKTLMLSKSSQHPQEAMELMRFLTSRDVQRQSFEETFALPTRTDVGELTEASNADVINGFLTQAKYGVTMPTNRVMGNIWGSLATTLPRVFDGTLTPESAADSIDALFKTLK